MRSFHDLTPAELRHTLRTMATAYARAAFHRLNPRAGDAAAWAWAERHWDRFEGRAADCLALIEARREQTAAN